MASLYISYLILASSIYVEVTSLLVLRLGGWVGVDTEINAKPAQAEAGVGAGAELGKKSCLATQALRQK